MNDRTNDETNDQMDFEEYVDDSEEIENLKLTMEEIDDYLSKTPLPKTWSWMTYTSRDKGITFTQINCTSKQVRCFIEVYEDLSIMV